ncbi:hypothetical protein RJ641_004776 [Dillenia turbinata]|uniref:Uncharacterized protein n=1 Tax=Dillenia turbinata TaxID=194707 RepID=A0AAN8VJP9_9MAGN
MRKSEEPNINNVRRGVNCADNCFHLWAVRVHCGNATTGTPPTKLSKEEFHPQCVKKQPTEGCDKTSICEHHGTIIPSVFGSTPLATFTFSSSSFSPLLILSISLITHKNGRPLSINPSAISFFCCWGKTEMLPKDT